jgi:hypothetical protein
MKEQTILKIAFIISVVGIMLLYLFSDGLVIEETRLNESIENGNLLKIIGEVSYINLKNKFEEGRNKTYMIMTIEQTNTIAVYVDQALNISKGMKVEVIGKNEDGMIFSDEIRNI